MPHRNPPKKPELPQRPEDDNPLCRLLRAAMKKTRSRKLRQWFQNLLDADESVMEIPPRPGSTKP
jgi:hypothetical protein